MLSEELALVFATSLLSLLFKSGSLTVAVLLLASQCVDLEQVLSH